MPLFSLTEFMNYIIIYIVIINIIAFAIMAADKKKARSKGQRVPESVLLTLSFIGGSVGSLLGLLICRHKTRHLKFVILFPLFLVLHILLMLLIFGIM